MAAHAIRRVVSYFAPLGRKTGPGFLNLHYWSIYFIKTKLYMHTKIWWSYVHIRYLVHVQKWTYLALGWPYGWALNFKIKQWKACYNIVNVYYIISITKNVNHQWPSSVTRDFISKLPRHFMNYSVVMTILKKATLFLLLEIITYMYNVHEA